MSKVEGDQALDASVATLVMPVGKKRVTEDALTDQSSRLSVREILVIFAALQSILFLAFVDQTSVTTVLPFISDDLGAADRINWVGTSFLIATLSSQLAISRLSDILGRVPVLLSAVGLFALGNILCGFAKTAVWLFASRGVSGVGAGGIISLVMVVVSDIVPLKERGKYQGFTGVTVALGSGIGPLIGGAVVGGASWRWVFWMTPPVCAALCPLIWYMIPRQRIAGNAGAKLKQVDFLVPLSGGGSIYAWDSALVITMLAVGVLLLVTFVLSQWKLAPIPILPLRIFKIRSVTMIMMATFTQGGVYYGLFFFLPVYFQEVLGHTAVESGSLLLPMVLSQPVTITLCGQFTSRTGYAVPPLQIGYAFHLLALGLMYRFTTTTSLGYIIGILILVGASMGMTLQTSLVAAQAAAPHRDRAVITGARNTARSFGGAIGLAAFGTIRNTIVKKNLAGVAGLDATTAAKIVTSGVASVVGNVDSQMLQSVREAVSGGVRDVFLAFLPLIALSFLFGCFIKNNILLDEVPIATIEVTPPLSIKEMEESSPEEKV